MSLLEDWRNTAYNSNQTRQSYDKFWNRYFEIEKKMYEEILANYVAGGEPVKGTVSSLAEHFGVNIQTMTGFLDGIDESLKTPNGIEEMDENTEVSLDFDPEKLYFNMVGAKANWLYELSAWEQILPAEKRSDLYRESKRQDTVVKPKKIGRNDPCPCGSGKKYKHCCGKNA